MLRVGAGVLELVVFGVRTAFPKATDPKLPMASGRYAARKQAGSRATDRSQLHACRRVRKNGEGRVSISNPDLVLIHDPEVPLKWLRSQERKNSDDHA